MSDDVLVTISGLTVDFQSSTGVVHAVKGADLQVHRGQTVAIVGESGSGKSTLAHALIDLLPAGGTITGGSIEFDGHELVGHPERTRKLRGRRIGLVPQDPMSNLNPVWRVGFQVKEALQAAHLADAPPGHRHRVPTGQVTRLLGDAGLPDAARRARQYPHEFSGGMRQRTLIAMGLAARPALVIADEPTSALDVTVQKRILDRLDQLTTDLGIAVLLVTHDLGLAAERAERVVVMFRGEVVEAGPALQLLRKPRHPYTQRLIAAAPSLGRTGRISATAATASGTGELAASEPLLQVDGLVKDFTLRGSRPGASTTFRAVDQVSFAVQRGTTTAIVGESGSGKTTVAHIVLGLQVATAGTVTFDGAVTGDGAAVGAGDRRAELRFRRRVQPVFQDPYGSLDPMHTVYRTIEEPLRVHRWGGRAARLARVREVMDQVLLPGAMLHRYPSELSGGQRQRVAIARALALQPDLLVLDEAVSALDVLVQDQVLGLLAQLQDELGLTYVFISHDLAVVRQIAHWVCVMHAGRIVEQAPSAQVFASPREPYTRELLAAIPGADLLS